MFLTKQQARALGVAIVAAVGFSGCATYAGAGTCTAARSPA